MIKKNKLLNNKNVLRFSENVLLHRLIQGPRLMEALPSQTEVSKVTLGSSPSTLVSRRGKLHGSICGMSLRAKIRVTYHCMQISLAEMATAEEAGKGSLSLCSEEEEMDLDKYLAIIHRHIFVYMIYNLVLALHVALLCISCVIGMLYALVCTVMLNM